jgi:hypothetical protein
VGHILVRALTLLRLRLQTRLDDIGGRGKVSSGHSSNGGSSERFAVAEDLAVATFVEDVFLQMGVSAYDGER